MPPSLESPVRHALVPFTHARTAKGEGGILTLEGVGVHYGEVNHNGFLFVPGCFKEGLKESPSERKPLAMGYQHDLFVPLTVIGRWTKATESVEGVELRGAISDTTDGRDAATLVEDGAINGLSIGHTLETYQFLEPGQRAEFDTPYGHFAYEAEEWAIAVIKGRIVETSLVAVPADDEARLDKVMHAVARAGRTLSLAEGADFEELAHSMGLLLSSDRYAELPELEHRGLYEQLARGYCKHGKTPPAYGKHARLEEIPFVAGELALVGERTLREHLDAAAAAAASLTGLSAETCAAAERTQAAIARLGRDLDAETRALASSLRQTHQLLTPRGEA